MRGKFSAALVLAAGLAMSAMPAFADPLAKPAKFAICSTCHSVVPGGANGIGPNLVGVKDRKAGTTTGFSYSPAMKASGLTWNKANLVKFIMAPKDTVPGTKMAFAGIKDQTSAEALADYLLSLK